MNRFRWLNPLYLLIAWAACHSVDQIAFHRSHYTKLPDWIWDARIDILPMLGIETLDVYHIAKDLSFWLFAAFWVLVYVNYAHHPLIEGIRRRWQQMISCPQIAEYLTWGTLMLGVWVLKGQIFNLFYHIIFIRPEYWEWPLPF